MREITQIHYVKKRLFMWNDIKKLTSLLPSKIMIQGRKRLVEFHWEWRAR